MIKVTNLHKYFFRHKRNEIHVLNDMTVTFPESGLVVLLGPSGSGKTTLLNVIGGLDSVQSGTIQFDDQMIKGYHSGIWDKIRNEKIGYIFQNYNLLPQLSVYDNIALVLKMMGINDPEIIEQRVHYMLHAVNMYPFRKKKSTQLSGGQQQRVAIARALVKNPEVIIADEPTGNLDSKNTLDIMNIIKEISKQKLVVLVTHERDLAKVYGDRIIEIKDGQIISDELNDSSIEHEASDDNTIYLKDLNQLTEMKDGHVNVALYQDSEQELNPIQVKLIIKNRTLYLDIDSSITKVKLIDASSNLKIKDEHYVKKNKEQMLETSFKIEHLDNRDVHRSFKAVVSIKSIFMLALQKILYSSKKGKIMLFSFILSGAVIAIMLSMAAATYIPSFDSMPLGDNYIRVIDNAPTKISYQTLRNYSDQDPNLYVNTLGRMNVGIIDPLEPDDVLLTMLAQFDIMPHAKGRMVKGRMGQAIDEIVITKAVADRVIDLQGPEYGIWSYEHLMIERFIIGDQEVKVTGILNSGQSIIYISRSLSNLIKPANRNLTGIGNVFYLGTLHLSNVTMTHGVIPTPNEVVISRKLFNTISSTPIADVTFPLTITNFPHPISGVFSDLENDIVIASDLIVEQSRQIGSYDYYVYSNNYKDMVILMTDDNLVAVDLREELIAQFDLVVMERRISITIVTLVVIGLTLLGFYFIMHSSMVSRIYEISVYRALGMKKVEIFISFLVEILIISTVTAVIGYGVASAGLISASSTLIGQFNLFLVNPLTIIGGIILVYVINTIGGMFPIFLLLRKTPAQILAQYDI
jgi:putative ABC transport system permease protein